jgi:hypothetical protein
MKYLKNFFQSTQTKEWDITDYIQGTYTINDGIIDVDGNVNLARLKIDKIPFKFGKVTGDFYCNNNNLNSLDGSPYEVGGDLSANINRLISLEGGPKKVGGNYHCLGQDFSNILTLISLKGSPLEVGGYINCKKNNICNFYGFDTIFPDELSEVDYQHLTISRNPVDEIYQLCPTIKFIKYLNEYSVIRGNEVLVKRLDHALYLASGIDFELDKLVLQNYKLVE